MANISIDAIADLPPQSEQPEDWRRFFGFSTDHKVIGIQYIVTSFIFFLIGGVLAMVIRGELITPESDLVDRAVYNSMFTMHGTIMLFLWTFPVLLGISNYLVPLMIGARDMAFPRLNAVAFWMVPVFGIILMASFFIPGGSSQSGWWAYP
ncbi:MAG: cbb3-type cytochrome c oxidase subunit I, partial [Pseudanabaena sp.]